MEADLYLTEDETKLFDALETANRKTADLNMRIAGGWVRDRIMGKKDSGDIDIAIDKMSGPEFANKIRNWMKSQEDYNKDYRVTIKVVGNSADAGRDFRTAKVEIRHVDKHIRASLDIVNLRPARKSCIKQLTGGQVQDVNSKDVIANDCDVKTEDLVEEVEKLEPSEDELIIGTPEDDAGRRDLTINSLFYNLGTKKIEDHFNGLEDLKNHILKTPTPATETIGEDPVRILRMARFLSLFNEDVVKSNILIKTQHAYVPPVRIPSLDESDHNYSSVSSDNENGENEQKNINNKSLESSLPCPQKPWTIDPDVLKSFETLRNDPDIILRLTRAHQRRHNEIEKTLISVDVFYEFLYALGSWGFLFTTFGVRSFADEYCPSVSDAIGEHEEKGWNMLNVVYKLAKYPIWTYFSPITDRPSSTPGSSARSSVTSATDMWTRPHTSERLASSGSFYDNVNKMPFSELPVKDEDEKQKQHASLLLGALFYSFRGHKVAADDGEAGFTVQMLKNSDNSVIVKSIAKSIEATMSNSQFLKRMVEGIEKGDFVETMNEMRLFFLAEDSCDAILQIKLVLALADHCINKLLKDRDGLRMAGDETQIVVKKIAEEFMRVTNWLTKESLWPSKKDQGDARRLRRWVCI